jgi:glutaredoxin-related protein
MAKQIQKDKQKAPAKKKPAETTQAQGTDVSASMDKIDKALTKVLYGAEEGDYEISGKSVAEVRQDLKAVMNIPNDAQARVDGKVVDGDYILQEQETLEFVKVAGQKG